MVSFFKHVYSIKIGDVILFRRKIFTICITHLRFCNILNEFQTFDTFIKNNKTFQFCYIIKKNNLYNVLFKVNY